MPPVVNKNDHHKILQDFQMQSEKRVMGIQPDIFVIVKGAVVPGL